MQAHLAQTEQLLSHDEHTLDTIEAELAAREIPPATTHLRAKRTCPKDRAGRRFDMIRAQAKHLVRSIYVMRCRYCQVSKEDTGSELTYDHFVPQSRGGTDDSENQVYACHARYSYSPRERWHFVWHHGDKAAQGRDFARNLRGNQPGFCCKRGPKGTANADVPDRPEEYSPRRMGLPSAPFGLVAPFPLGGVVRRENQSEQVQGKQRSQNNALTRRAAGPKQGAGKHAVNGRGNNTEALPDHADD